MARAAYRMITQDLGLKLFSVVVAVTLWVYVLNTQDPMRSETVHRAIRPVNVPEGLESVKVLPESIALRLTGRLSALDRTALANLQVLADLSDGVPGRNQAPLGVINVPERAKVESMDRHTAQVWLDERTADRTAVTAVVTGSPPEGYEVLGEVRVEPSQVRVTGPAGALERLARVTARVDVEGLTEPQKLPRALEALDSRQIPIAGITLEPQQVIVTVPIHKVATKQVAVNPRIGAPPAGYVIADVRASPDTVTIKGRPDVVRQVREINTEWQSISDLRTTRDYSLRLAIPEGVQPVDDVRSVRVQVALRPVTPAPAPAEGRPPEPEESPREPAPPESDNGEDAAPSPDAETPTRAPAETPTPSRPADAAGRERAPTATPGEGR